MADDTRALAHLRLERPADGVAVLTLDNPDQRNAMSDEMTASWVAAVDELAGDRSVRVVVVTGEGSAFCSGGNTSWIASEPDATVDELRERMLPFYRAWLSISHAPERGRCSTPRGFAMPSTPCIKMVSTPASISSVATSHTSRRAVVLRRRPMRLVISCV
jgi:1,4-dihydroxy-2-naphthoyl-CoA synthase